MQCTYIYICITSARQVIDEDADDDEQPSTFGDDIFEIFSDEEDEVLELACMSRLHVLGVVEGDPNSARFIR